MLKGQPPIMDIPCINFERRSLRQVEEFIHKDPKESDTSLFIKESVLLTIDRKPAFLYYKDPDWTFPGLAETLRKIKYYRRMSLGVDTVVRHFGFQPGLSSSTYLGCGEHTLEKEERDVIYSVGQTLTSVYQRFFPSQYEQHWTDSFRKIKSEYRIPYTPFTNGIISRNNALRYHYDQGNFPTGQTVMITVRDGVENGYLSIPSMDVKIETSDSSISIWDGRTLLHGVTPMTKSTPESFRASIVYYTLQKLWECE